MESFMISLLSHVAKIISLSPIQNYKKQFQNSPRKWAHLSSKEKSWDLDAQDSPLSCTPEYSSSPSENGGMISSLGK